MDLSLIDSLTPQLLPTESNSTSSLTTHPINSQSFSKKQAVSVLRQSIRNKQQQRLKSQYSRKIKNKQNQLEQLGKKCTQFEKQIKNINKIKSILITEKQQILQKNHLNQLEIQSLKKQLQTVQESNKKYQLDLEKIKKENQTIMQQLSNEKDKYDSLCKQNKIQMRRINQTYESNRLQLQAKFAVKQKQHQKIQNFLEQKKQEFYQAVAIRDQELAYVKDSYKQLQINYAELQKQLQKQQNQKINQYKAFQEEIKSASNNMQELQFKYHTFAERINQTIKLFKQDLCLKSEDEDIFKQIEKFKQELMNRQQTKHFQEKITQISLQLSSKIRTQKELISKIQILKDELSFVKSQINNNNNFAAIIKSQMSTDCKTINLNQAQQSKLSTKIVQPIFTHKRHQEKENIISTNKQFSLSQQLAYPLSDFNRYHSIETKLQKQLAFSNDQTKYKHSKVKSTNDFLKQQLQSKKKSLIYLMYRRQQDQTNYQNLINTTNTKPKSTQIAANRKRSNSLSNLITNKCREQIL